MKLHDFSKLVGLPLTKLRYYTRYGVIEAERNENNYREFEEKEVLDVYNTLILRDFDMSINDIVKLNNDELEEPINLWVNGQIDGLEDEIRKAEIRLNRLKEMRNYFECMNRLLNTPNLDVKHEEYVYWIFDEHFELNKEVEENLANLANKSPFSYVALKVPHEKWVNQEKFHVTLGIGVLKRNIEKCGIEKLNGSTYVDEAKIIGIYLEKENPLELTKSEIQPLLDKAKEMNVEVYGDISGRFYLKYNKDGKKVYNLAISIKYR